jgi:diguanylate cyclase (GGDEF)-like protein
LFAITLRPEQLYVVYTYNFLKNIQWSESQKGDSYSLLVLTDNDLLKENFTLLTQKRGIGSHPIFIDYKRKKSLDKYNAIFIDKVMLPQYLDIYKSIEGKQTLLISVEYPDKQQIMINLTKAQTIQLNFEINRANIINQNLGISDEMILLGGTEIDVAKLYKKTRRSLEVEEEHSKKLSLKIKSSKEEAMLLEEQIKRQNTLLQQQNNTINNKEKEIQDQVNALAKKKEIIQEQEYIINAQVLAVTQQTEVINNLKENITKAKDDLEKITSQVTLRNSEIEKQQKRLNDISDKALLKDREIDKQNSILSKLEKRITENQNDLILKEATISSQKGVILVLSFFLMVIAVLIFFLIKLGRENRRQAERDFLTGLYNRRYFSKRAKKMHAKGVNKENPISVAMFDIDYFKSVNDTYGHDVGDKVLQTVALILKDKFKNRGLLARWGGEEFIAMSRLSKKETLELFESIKEEVALCVFEGKEGKSFSVTISIGVHYLQSNHSLEVMIEAADKLLYTAKDQGRNRIIYNT